MSRAIRCDRCKTCFDPWTVDGDFIHIRDIRIRNKADYANNEYSYVDEEYDLCPHCTKIYIQFSAGKALFALEDYVKLEKEHEDLQAELDRARRLLNLAESRKNCKGQNGKGRSV